MKNGLLPTIFKRDQRGVARVILPIILVIALLAVAVYGTYTWQHRKLEEANKRSATAASQPSAANNTTQNANYEFKSAKGVTVKIYAPERNAKISSPVVVVGQVPGNWSFEASFPVQIKNAEGNVIAKGIAQVIGDWMTDKNVVFTAKIDIDQLPQGKGTLVLVKDNPSGLEENNDSVSLPIQF